MVVAPANGEEDTEQESEDAGQGREEGSTQHHGSHDFDADRNVTMFYSLQTKYYSTDRNFSY